MLIDDIYVSEPLKNQHSFARFSAGDESAIRKKIVIVLPGHFGGNVISLEKLFNRFWKARIIDEVVVLSDARCRVFCILFFLGKSCDPFPIWFFDKRRTVKNG